MSPRENTRMGPVTRRLTPLLCAVEARARRLASWVGGGPDDDDCYRRGYCIENTHEARIEGGHPGTHPFRVTIDSGAGNQCLRACVAVHKAVQGHVRRLPAGFSDIDRRPTP